MIPTFKVQNGGNAQVGNLQVQPVVTDVNYTVKQQSTTSRSVSSPGPLPASEASINATTLVHGSQQLQTVKATSLASIASSLVTNPKFVVPGLQGRSPILPTYALKLSPIVPFNTTLLDNLTVTTKKFEPYEQLTGISQDRPELVMLTSFLPLFDKGSSYSSVGLQQAGQNAFMTDAGRLIDAQIQVRNLRFANVANLLNGVRDRHVAVANSMTQRKDAFHEQVSALQDTSSFLLTFMKSITRAKQQFDLRNDLYIVDPTVAAQRYVLSFSAARSVPSSQGVLDIASRMLPPKYDVPDVLVRMGYTSDNVKANFSSTKMWLQLQLELRNIVRAHSLEFLDIEPVQQSTDDNAVVLTKSTSNLFTLGFPVSNLGTVKELSALQTTAASQTASVLTQAYALAYQNISFKTDEAKIAMLGHALSQEYRYSRGLAQPEVVSTLGSYYGYKVVPNGNYGVFDAVFGRFGNNISDLPASVTNDLASLSQQQPAENVAVLTFESKYLNGDTGTLTPGSAYYIDNMLETTTGQQFDTSRLSSLATTLESANKQFNTITNSMNLLSVHVSDPQDPQSTSYTTLLESPSDFVQSVISQLVSTAGSPLPVVTNDRLTSVYAMAATDASVRSALFLLTVGRITRAYSMNVPYVTAPVASDNTPLVDELIEQVITALGASVKQTSTSVFSANNRLFSSVASTDTMTNESIRTAFKQGTSLMAIIETTMSKVLTAFNSSAVINSQTRYSGCLDTVLMMMLFDMIVSAVAKYGNQTITGAKYGQTSATKNTLTFTVAKANVNYANSLRDVSNRIQKEMAFVHQGVYAVTNTLQKLAGSLRGLVNYLNGSTTITKMKQVSDIIADPTLFHLTLSEQQILALASNVSDLVSQVNNLNVAATATAAFAAGSTTSDDEIRALDDSVISPQLEDVLYGLLSDQEYASLKGFNKKVLTVGVPLGFTQRLKQVVSVTNLKKTSFVNKREDIVKVTVYKVDLENSDIVYKPLTYLFEMSRFPVRDSSAFLPVPNNASIEDIVSCIPTRDLTQSSTDTPDTIDYMSSKDADVTKFHSVAFDDPSYDFLDQRQRFEILRNHVTSYVMEVYLKLMTGMNVADTQFDIVEAPKPVGQDFIQLITQHHIASVVDSFNVGKITQVSTTSVAQPPVGGILFRTTAPTAAAPTTKVGQTASAGARQLNNASGRSSAVSITTQFSAIPSLIPQRGASQSNVASIGASMSQISQRAAGQVLHDLRTISNMSGMVTPMADPVAVSQRLLKPKQFDRVFNVIVDPDDFEIDHDKTVATPQGSQALAQMISRGDIVAETPGETMQGISADLNFGLATPRNFIQGRIEPNVNKYRFRDRDKNEGDLTFEKYFVTVDTFDEEEV